jgi:hypothetical protein
MRRLLALIVALVLWSAVPASAATAFRSASFKTGTGAGSGAVTEPAGCTSGDVEIALTLTVSSATSLTRPASWTNLYNGTSTTPKFDYDVSWIARTGSAPSLTWTWTGSVYYEVHILCISGADTSAIDGSSTLAGGASGNPQSSIVDPAAVTVATTNAFSVAIGVHWNGSAPSWIAPATPAYTMRSDNTSGNDGMMATRQLTATGSENPDGFDSAGGVADDWIAVLVVFKEAAAGGAVVPKLMLLGVGGVE